MFILLAGFAADYIGDYILGKSERTSDFIAGSCLFAVGHILYIVGISMAEKYLFPQVLWLNGFEAGVFLAVICVMLLILLVKKPAFEPMLALMFVYCMIVTLMISKAAGLAVRMLPDAPSMLLLPAGAVCFLFSDYTLGMMRFKMHEKTIAFKSACTATYFAAQTMIALSMFTLIRY